MPASGREAVTVVGLGPMGQQIVRTYLAAGFAVTVWNRTAGKADGLGARRADSVTEAVAAAELIVLSLTHYDAMDDILESVDLTGKVVVNLSSDSPQRTRRGAAFVRARGGEFLAGGVMAQPPELAGPDAYIFYSGPAEVFEARRELLRPLAAAEYLGVDDGLAQVYYQAMLALFLPLLLGYEQALAIIDRSGSEIDRFVPYAQRSLGSVGELYAAWAGTARDGGLDEPAYLRMMAAGARHVMATGVEAGVDGLLAEAVSSYWERSLGASESTFQVMRGVHAVSAPDPSLGNGSVENTTSTATSK
ncbi:NAD(P)-binding domain-containing protein [Nocardia sp. PE-7]|uniref:NAD(P)-dependent oxidoreductase n=1 Tax=Nocardia sp. PE-7 TaxID=3058426 RepID=UPI002657AFBE|nr:NAD(P)-binding domain-containing protein [Nocardia sp. PE-7]WKG09444.1 NAD(P)-binding domain-containing protein [Nocardia sp. PE-7]